ncbi:MAG: beta-lactamase family protein [Holophagales bacterium]|nr:beta-lactamase family protein [Holophagales bacterium]
MPHRDSLPRARRRLEEGIERGLHPGAQVYVSLGGRAYELALGRRADDEPMETTTLNLWLSSTKPVTAVAVALLWQAGDLGLDDPVARHVPEFAAHGKGGITLRHLLTHTAGIRMLNIGWPEASWEEILTTICSRRPEPRWTPGQKAGYHMASSWFVLGEVISRVAGRPFPRFVREEVLEPCGMDDSFVGMPEELYPGYAPRLGRMWGTEGEEATPRRWHRPRSVVGSSPGGNGWGPVRELGRFYEMLLHGGCTRSGRQLLLHQTVEALTTPHRVGMVDQTFRQKLDWGLGFIVDSKHYGESLVAYGYGAHASRRTFGHSGFQSSTAFADPEHGLVVAVLVNGQPGEPVHTERMKAVTEAVYEDLGLAAATEET